MLKKIILKGEQKKVLFLPPTNPIQIKGVAGSGKTTVALYRAKHLLETQANLFKETKIVIFTYNKTLAAYINALKPFVGGGYQKDSDEIKPKTRDGLNVKIVNFHSWAFSFLEQNGIKMRETEYENGKTKTIWKTVLGYKQTQIVNRCRVRYLSNSFANKPTEFFEEEIAWIKGKLFQSRTEYINARRTGRGTADRVTKDDKEIIWNIYSDYNKELDNMNKMDYDDYASKVLEIIDVKNDFIPPFTHVIIDEAQDLSKAQVLAISKLVSPETNSITLIADAAQRIYKSGFTWSEVGIEVRGGRTISFKKNYRNTIQIAQAANSLLEKETDREDFTEIQFSVRNGQRPKIGIFSNRIEQYLELINQLDILKTGNQLSSTIVLNRTHNGVQQIDSFLNENNYSTELIKDNNYVNYDSDSVKICTMSSIKGLEFNSVFILDLNDNIIPSPTGFIDSDDEYHISTERRLLYTCMTRAENKLFLFSSDSDNPSRYLEEIEEDFLDDIVTEKELNKISTRINYNRLYFSGSDNLYSCFKFFEDGEVIGVALGANILDISTQRKVNKWFVKGYSVGGQYVINDNQISFTIKTSKGNIEYNGAIEDNKLVLNVHSHINGSKSKRKYQCIENINENKSIHEKQSDYDDLPF
jgi:superfamily I DNA/RNA helicase